MADYIVPDITERLQLAIGFYAEYHNVQVRVADLADAITEIKGLREALDAAIGAIESAEKDTNFVSGDPYGDSLTVELRRALAGAER